MNHDVIIIGGGPAGATAATLLAQAGQRVVVIEKDPFPRFHIGESLLPGDVPVLERLGLGPELQRFVRKGGAEFRHEKTGRKTEFAFGEGLPGGPGYAYQVERSIFDDLLLRRARAVGAHVIEGEKVMRHAVADDHVEVGTVMTGAGPDAPEATTLRARFLVDATGQDALLGRRQGTIQPYHGFGKAAVFCHFDGLSDAACDELYASGNIRIHGTDDGWAWVIPLAGARLSVGVVSREKGLSRAHLDTFIATSPTLVPLTAGATRSEPRIIRNFSYRNLGPAGPRWACIGDAACFLDPLFSSGVSLAMLSAERMVDVLHPALSAGREADPQLMAPLSTHMERAYASFANLIYRFYNTNMADNVFFGDATIRSEKAEHAAEGLRQGVISVLACDLWRDDNTFQQMLLRAHRHDPLTHDPDADRADRADRPGDQGAAATYGPGIPEPA